MFIASHLTACLWAGRILSLLVVIALLGVAANILFVETSAHAQLAAAGFPQSEGPLIGITAIVRAMIYAIPQTSVLGAILVTGFLGGAICTHFRLGEMCSLPQTGLHAWMPASACGGQPLDPYAQPGWASTSYSADAVAELKNFTACPG